MNVLSITGDLNALREKSSKSALIAQLGSSVRHLVVIVLNERKNRYGIKKVSDSLLVVPTNSLVRALAPLQALRIARRELFFQGQLQADVIFADDPLYAGVAGMIISRIFKRPLCVFIPTNILSARYGQQSFAHLARMMIARFVVRRADSLAIASESIRASLADMSTAIADRALMSPHFMDVDAFQKEPIRVDLTQKYPQFKFLMLAVAPLVPSSNLKLAIKVVARVVRVYPFVGLVIVGEGPERAALLAYAQELGVADRIAFENWSDNLASYFKTARVFLVTAPFDEYLDTIEQAAAASCAIISTRVGVAPTIIEDSVSGFLCEIHEEEKYAAEIILLIRKPEVCNSIRLNANLALQNFITHDAGEYLKFHSQLWERALHPEA